MMSIILRFLILLFILLISGGCADYDPYTPDTAGNRAGFTRHMGQAPSPDVKGVYYYADQLGADVTYQLRFEADPPTVDKLVKTLGLSDKEPAPAQSIARSDLKWWPADRIKKITPTWKTNSTKDHFWMLWYDEKQHEAFFLEFSL